MTERAHKSRTRALLLPPLLTLILLGGFRADQAMWRVAAPDAAPYHALVQDAATRVPFHIGSWLGTDVPIPPAAVKLLKPNVVVSRRFEEMRSGQKVDLLLVQCTDARDLLGHYPPICYVTNGWTKDSAQPRDWNVDGLEIPGTAYEFSTTRNGLPARMTVYNFIVLPDGQICRGMDEADVAAQDLRRKFLGAAQVQLVFSGDDSPLRNDEVLEMMVHANRGLIDILRRGSNDEKR